MDCSIDRQSKPSHSILYGRRSKGQKMVAKTSKTEVKPKLRFAALCRVSTEKQKKRGESLAVQKSQIQEAVKTLGGTVVSWYGGQEHATEGFEKAEIDRLLTAAQKESCQFNAFICNHADRWSRDNSQSHRGLEILNKSRIRFFIRTSEYDLQNPEHRLFLEMSAVFGSFQARHQKLNSIDSRIAKAKRGCSACGKRPFGRTWDKQDEKWGVDEKKKAMVEDVARRYLAGGKLPMLADEYGVNHANLHKVLTKRCGDTWTQEFRKNSEVISVETKVPRLLSNETIAALRRKAAANRTYNHGQQKYFYLLHGFIFCEDCGYAMFGQTNHNGHQYYRHAHERRMRKCNTPKTWIPEEVVSDLVMRYLFDMFGNPVAIQKAVEKAMPDLQKIKQYQKRVGRIGDELKKVERSRERTLRRMNNEDITESQASKEFKLLKQKESSLCAERDRLNEYLGNRPNESTIRDVSRRVFKQFSRGVKTKLTATKRHIDHAYGEMTNEDKRALLEMIFSGKLPNGRPMGVYITWNEDKQWRFSIRGHLISETGLLPLTEAQRKAFFNFDESGGGHKRKELVVQSANRYIGRSLP